ncbi:MAG: OsmC family protein [Bacteroidia bacterium]
MYTSEVIYQGQLRTIATHLQSGNIILTDAPKDNQGNGEFFSPTDLVATALGACMLTIMGIEAKKSDINIIGSTVKVIKKMGINPRRIIKLIVELTVTDYGLSEAQKAMLENAALNCPVAKSIHPDIEQDITFNYVTA